MSEDYISLDIRPSYLEDITDLLEREIEKSDCFEEISHYFAIMSDLEEEYFHATAKKNDEYKRHHDEQHCAWMLRKYINEGKQPPFFITKDEDYIDKALIFKERLKKEWSFKELFTLYLIIECKVDLESATKYIDEFDAWCQKEEKDNPRLDYW